MECYEDIDGSAGVYVHRPAGLAKTISEVGVNFFQLCFVEKNNPGQTTRK